MRTSIWYRDEEKRPDKSGHYLAYRGFGMGGSADGDSPHGYLYYDKQRNEWRTHQSRGMFPDVAIVYYWTDATPDDWTDSDPPSIRLAKKHFSKNVTLDDAWKKVQEAIEQYNIIKRLIE